MGYHRELRFGVPVNAPLCDRRDFLIGAGCAACSCVLASCAGSPTEAPTTTSGPIDVGKLSDYPPTDGISARFARNHGFYLVRRSGRLMAVAAICTHRRCAVDLDAVPQQYVCACHGSRFTADGVVLKGPATVSLPHFGISVDSAGHVIVDAARRFDEAKYGESGSFVALG
jgi:Rieske Fe-S protein